MLSLRADSRVSLANGDHLTTSTAGIVGTFWVTARDSFENKRPGGDTVNALMNHWNVAQDTALDASADPQTGTVSDNRDGSFSISYRLTRAGMYTLDLQIANALAAQAPYKIIVHSDTAVPEKTFVFGSLLTVKQGDASNIYAQTRDRYGNYIRLDPGQFPEGIENLQFELCIVIGNQTDPELSLACAGGEEEEGVGRERFYAVGPGGTNIDPSTGEYYWGIYKFTFNPLVQGSFIPQVKHNGSYISCYFDTDELLPGANETTPSVEFPPIADVDSCMAAMANSVNSSKFYAGSRRERGSQRYTEIGGFDEAVQEGHQRRLLATEIRAGEFSMKIQSSFTYPDTSDYDYWLSAAPLLCALVGCSVELVSAMITCALAPARAASPVLLFASSCGCPFSHRPHHRGPAACRRRGMCLLTLPPCRLPRAEEQGPGGRGPQDVPGR